MRMILSALIAVVLAAPAAAQEDGLSGYWKFNIYEQGQQISFWLVHLDKDKDNKLTISAEPLKDAPRVKVEDIKLDGDTMRLKFIATIFGMAGARQVTFDYEAKLPKPGAKKIFGSLSQGGSTVPAIMESTAAKTPFEVERETLLKTPTDPKALAAIVDVIEKAKDNKIDAKDLQTWVDASLKTAELYGPRFQLKHNLRLLNALQGQKPYAAIGIETARKVGKQVDPKMPLDTQAQILGVAASVLKAGGEAAEADAILGRLDKLEMAAYSDYASTKGEFKVTKFAGRQGKSKRAVLVELFTGAQCPPCVAADLAFDGVEKTYGPGEAVLLQYHLHIPGPDPLTNKDTDDRFEHYADAYPKQVRGTPTNLFNGKLAATGGGGREDAADKYKEFCDVVNKLLESPDSVKVTATASRKGDKIAIAANVTTTEKLGDKVRLRLALVEDWVRYKGGNGLQYHHRVVRAMPGGVKGVAVKDKDFDFKASVDLDDLRAALNKYLNEDYPEGPRPMRMRNLSVVAFVQDDATHEVLQAVNVAVKE